MPRPRRQGTSSSEAGQKILVDGKSGQEIIRIDADPKVAKANAIRAASGTGMAHTNVDYGGSVTSRGNCGSSTLGINTRGSVYHGHDLTTVATAYDFQWEVDYTLNGRYFGRFFDRGPIQPRKTWTSGLKVVQGPGAGRLVANVVPGVSQAYLITGGVCFSGGPLETADLA